MLQGIYREELSVPIPKLLNYCLVFFEIDRCDKTMQCTWNIEPFKKLLYTCTKQFSLDSKHSIIIGSLYLAHLIWMIMTHLLWIILVSNHPGSASKISLEDVRISPSADEISGSSRIWESWLKGEEIYCCVRGRRQTRFAVVCKI